MKGTRGLCLDLRSEVQLNMEIAHGKHLNVKQRKTAHSFFQHEKAFGG